MARHRSGFTLIELLVVVAIVGLLAAVLLPSLANARRQARATVCMSNCKEIGLAAQMYAMQFGDTFPPSAHGGGADPKNWWLHRLANYAKAPLLFQCPDDEGEDFLDWSKKLPPAAELDQYRWASYAVNYLLVRDVDDNNQPITPFSDHMSRIRRPQYTILIAESHDSLKGVDHIHPDKFSWTDGPEGQVATERHFKKANYVFADGHVARLFSHETWVEGSRTWWDPVSAPAWGDSSTGPPPPPPPP